MKITRSTTKKPVLPSPAFYNPWSSGKFEIKAGFHRLAKDFGNGDLDSRIFQIDNQYEYYLSEKDISFNDTRNQHYLSSDLTDITYLKTIDLLLTLLKKEYSAYFNIKTTDGNITVENSLTNEFLFLEHNGSIVKSKSRTRHHYKDGLDALCMQLQEDFSIIEPARENRVSMLNISFPNHWAPEDKIGKSFITIHDPVPNMENINKNAHALVSSTKSKGPFVRFAWGLASSERLNCHPDHSKTSESTRKFNSDSRLYVRLERQTLINIPGTESVLFTIRSYFYDVHQLSSDDKSYLIAALNTMETKTIIYKGLKQNIEAIISTIL